MRCTVGALLLTAAVTVASSTASSTTHAASDPTRGQARVLVDQQPGVAPLLNAWQSQGGATSIVVNGIGQYTIHLGGLTGIGGNVQLEPYMDTGAGEVASWCSIESWGPDSTTMMVNVGCWSADGSPAATVAFSVLFNNSTTYPKTAYEAFWSGSGAFTGTITPPATWVMNHTPRLTHTSTGHYTVEYLGVYPTPFPLVTAWGSSAHVCNVVDWYNAASTISPHETGRFVRIACYDFAGHALDSAFSFLMSDHSPLGVDGRTGGRVLTNLVVGTTMTPTTDNVNNSTGVDQPSNSYLNSVSPSPATRLYIPGWPGAYGSITAADTLQSIGDDPTKCLMENPVTQNLGDAVLLVFCYDIHGAFVIHRVHGGTWHL